MDAQVDYFLAGPDVDGDGRRDLVRTLADGTLVAAASRNGR